MEPEEVEDPGEVFDEAEAEQLLAQARIDEAVEARRRERWMRQRFVESASIAGLLLGAVGRRVGLHLVTGDLTYGTIAWVGIDVVEVEGAHSPRWIALAAIDGVESLESLAGSGPPPDPGSATFSEVLVDLVAERTAVCITLRSGFKVGGELRSVGDVLELGGTRAEGQPVPGSQRRGHRGGRRGLLIGRGRPFGALPRPRCLTGTRRPRPRRRNRPVGHPTWS